MKKLLSICVLLLLLPSALFSVSFLDERIKFDVPPALEVRSELYEELFARVAEDIHVGLVNNDGEDTLKVVLQQKGLNIGDKKANSQYCRITLSVSTDDSSSIPNWVMRESFDYLSHSDKEEYETLMRNMSEMTAAVINWYPTTYEDIGGLFAISNHYTRKSTSGNISPVEVYSYTIVTGIHTITIMCSYRQSQARTFVPAINEFLESLVFNFPEDSYELESIDTLASMYSHQIPGTQVAFMWPEMNPSWVTVDDNSMFKTKQITYSNFLMEGYFCSIGYLEFVSPLSRYQMSSMLASTINEALTILRTNTIIKNVKLLENSYDSDSGRLKYSYSTSIDDSKLHGFSYLLNINNTKIVSVSAEYYDDSGDNAEAILQSVMDSLDLK